MTRLNYIDPPHELAELIRSTLERHLSSSGLRVNADVYERDVVLSGVVGSWYQKQLAQESLLALDEVDLVDNRITVDYQDRVFDPQTAESR